MSGSKDSESAFLGRVFRRDFEPSLQSVAALVIEEKKPRVRRDPENRLAVMENLILENGSHGFSFASAHTLTGRAWLPMAL